MSVIIMKNLGDTLIIGMLSQSLDNNDPMPVHYKSLWMDMPTDYVEIISHENEMDMITFINDWDICDEAADKYERIAVRFTMQGRQRFMP